MDFFPDLSIELKDFFECGLVISPWLADLGTVRFDPEVFAAIEFGSREFSLKNWTPAQRFAVFGYYPSNERLIETSVYEIVASTAVFLAHERTGSLDVDYALADEVLELVNQYARRHGFSTLIQVYLLATSWENQHALAYYGEIPENTFLLGHWHRPWIDYSIWDEVLLGCYLGTMEIIVNDGVRYVQLTKKGQQVLSNTTKILEKSGYFAYRLQALRISQFTQFIDYHESANEIWPHMMSQRRSFLDWVGIKPGMKVLELGCANGIFTFDGGLAELVGPGGFVVAIDPSSGMIARAKERQKDLNINWVKFVQARAEALPFADGEFDAVIGVAFLHFTDRPAALKEMARVVRPGGVVASYHPTKFNANIPFFTEWFAPLFELAAKRGESPKDYLPCPEEVSDAFITAGLDQIITENADVLTVYHDPVKVVRHFIEGVGWFSEELCQLPWKARLDLIKNLKQRGHNICEKYQMEERTIEFPNQMIKAIKPQFE